MLNYNKAVWATYTGQSKFSELLSETRRTDSLYNATDKSPEYYQQLLRNVYDNASDFEILSKIKKSGLISDPLLQRQSISFFREYLFIKNNWDETEDKQTRLLDHFFELKKNENCFFDSLKNIPNTEARSMWIEKFSELTGEFKEMLRAMNNDARRLGYDNYFHYNMENYEVSVSELDEILNFVKIQTDADYDLILENCREILAEEFNTDKENLLYEHYRYAHSQMIFPKSWYAEYSRDDFINKLKAFYQSGGYDIRGILAKSDIWYDKNKTNNSFFFCLDIDQGDMRVYSNSHPNSSEFYMLIHEFGHALHYENIGKEVPYFLKNPNPIIAEAVAIYFDSKIYVSPVHREMLELPSLETNPYFKNFTHPSRLLFIRKLLRNIEFEKSFFENPEQDLNALWWDLNRKYLHYDAGPDEQVPEWLSNQHVVYCSGINVFYLYAIIIAAQLEHCFPGQNVSLLKEKVMKYGDSLPWKDIVKKATGEEINLEYLFNSYKKGDEPTTNKSIDALTFFQSTPDDFILFNNQL